jgi:tetratricopeptide (TPR) repeat protein
VNGPTGVDWTAALLVLAAGLVLGTVIVWKVLGRSRAAAGARGPAPAVGAPDVFRRDLEGKSLALLAQLRELDDTATKRTDEQLARERYALELEAARTLLALGDAEKTSSRAASAPPVASPAAGVAPPAPDRAAMRGFLWGTLSAGGVGVLLFLLYTQARPREEGGSLTGDIPGARSTPLGGTSAAGASAPLDAGEVQLRERISRNPDDLDAHMGLARAALARQDMMAVWNETKAVLERSPGHPQALAYQALVRLAMGQGDVALEMLEQSLARNPDLIDAYVHKALVEVRLGRLKEAEATIAGASRRFPGEAAGLGRLLADLKQGQAERETGTPSGADPHADLATPGPGDAGTTPPAGTGSGGGASSGRRVSGTVDLDPALRSQVAAQGVLFVFVREAGFGAGPPIAAKRLPVSSFPVAFEIGEADAMMGQPFPDALLVEARLDADGDPVTRPPTDPKARLDDVKSGTTNVKLVLKRIS